MLGLKLNHVSKRGPRAAATAMALTKYEAWVPVFQEEGFQQPQPLQFVKIIENAKFNIFLSHTKKIIT